MYQLWRISLDKIYIPTLGRHDNQITYNALPDKWKKLVIMVVQKKEEIEEVKSWKQFVNPDQDTRDNFSKSFIGK